MISVSDLRYALRMLARSPGFTAVTSILLALGIGAACTIFSALDAVMLRRLPVRDPQNLFLVVRNLPQLGKRGFLPPELFAALEQRATLVNDVSAECYRDLALTDPPAEPIRVHFVAGNYFSALGASAKTGRVLSPADHSAAVLSHSFWQRRFGGRDVLGE